MHSCSRHFVPRLNSKVGHAPASPSHLTPPKPSAWPGWRAARRGPRRTVTDRMDEQSAKIHTQKTSLRFLWLSSIFQTSSVKHCHHCRNQRNWCNEVFFYKIIFHCSGSVFYFPPENTERETIEFTIKFCGFELDVFQTQLKTVIVTAHF